MSRGREVPVGRGTVQTLAAATLRPRGPAGLLPWSQLLLSAGNDRSSLTTVQGEQEGGQRGLAPRTPSKSQGLSPVSDLEETQRTVLLALGLGFSRAASRWYVVTR